MRNQRWCYAHNPALTEERSENGRRGGRRAGRGRSSFEVAGIRDQLRELVALVRAGEMDKGSAAVCGQLLNVSLRALEVSMRLREQDELFGRLEALESREGRAPDA